MRIFVLLKLLTVSLGMVFCFAVTNSYAAESEGIYLVDMQRVISESSLGIAAKSSLESEAKKKQESLGAQKAELDKLKGELQSQAAVLSQAAVDEKKNALEKRARDFERSIQDNREEMMRKQGAAIEKIVAQAQQIIKDLAAENKYKMIIEKDARVVLYADPKLDVTSQVVKALNNKSKT